MIQPRAADELVGMRLVNRGTTLATPGVITFGQVFKPGALRPDQGLVARSGPPSAPRPSPVQLDLKATHRDGSVRHALLSLRAPALAPGGALDLMLVRVDHPAPGAPIVPVALVAAGADVSARFTFGDGTSLIADAGPALAVAKQSGTLRAWLSGPLVSEFRLEIPLSPRLRAVFDLRFDADRRLRTALTVANDATFLPDNRTTTYALELRRGSQMVASWDRISHYRNANWRTVIEPEGRPPLALLRDVDYLSAAGAIPAFDTTIGINQAALAQLSEALGHADRGPLGNALVTRHMPETGGRADLGPTTAWSALYLISQDPRAEAAMLAGANASGSVPWHFRDEATGHPVRLDQHPRLWLDPRAGRDGPATPYLNLTQDTGWTPDTAHPPALAYVAYLVTGERYYLDEVQAEASWQLAAHAPGYRDQVGTAQVRDLAWSLRDLGNAAYATPDTDPLKGYFTAEIGRKLDQLVQYYVSERQMKAAGAVEGWVKGPYGDNKGTVIAPWQEDYLAIVLAGLARQGWPQAGVLLAWMDNFIAGRFLNRANGFDPWHGPAYNLTVVDPLTRVPYASWSEVSQASFGAAAAPTRLDGYPELATGAAAMARAALASLISVTGSPRALQAWHWLSSGMARGLSDYGNHPTWALRPGPPAGPSGPGQRER